MWLTGFDVPSLATMYIYKPMHGYNLMQAIARVNRVFKDKEGGLIVDYVGIASALKAAMKEYGLYLYFWLILWKNRCDATGERTTPTNRLDIIASVI